MPSNNGKININLIKSFCTLTPDANIILHFIFEEEHFKLKVDHFLSLISSGEIPCEIMPGVNREVTKRLFSAVKTYINICRFIKSWIKEHIKDPADIIINKDVLQFFEDAFSDLFSSHRRMGLRYRDIRVVEDALVNLLYRDVQGNVKISLEDFFRKAEDQLSKKFEDFSYRQSIFASKINANILRETDILPVTRTLETILENKCGIRDAEDRSQLGETISRMYQTNRWYGFVSTDYTHIINHRREIEKYTQLIVDDPLYILYHLDKAVNTCMHPRESATKRKIPYGEFVRFSSQPGIV